jgi:ABC-type spermidine/putrescine transport system permease subunit I
MPAPVTPDSERRRPLGLLLVAPPVLLAFWLVIFPAAGAVWSTFRVETPEGAAWSLENYAFFFTDAYSLANLRLTVLVTAMVCTLVVGICLPIAIYLRYATGPLPALVQTLVLFPLFVPSIIVAYAFIRMLGPNGFVDTVLVGLGLPKIASPYLSPWGPVIGLVWDSLPLTLLLLLAGLGNVPKAAIEAARDVGAGRLAILTRIILPRIWQTLLVTLSFNVIGNFSAFTLPYLLGPAAPEMMGPFMDRTFGDVQDVAAAKTQATVTFAICAAFGALYVWSIARGRRARAEAGR